MLRISMLALSLSVMAVPCFAQRGGGGGGRPQTAVELVGVAEVQEELTATAEQKGKLNEIAAKVQEQRTAGRRGGRGQDAAERAKQRAELAKKLTETFMPQIAEVLQAEQVKRLHQISWQAMGALALQEEEVAKALELNQEAKDKITAAIDDYNANAPGFGSDASRQERQAFVEKRDMAIMAALSDTQKEEFEELKGEEFDVSVLNRGRGGRRGSGN